MGCERTTFFSNKVFQPPLLNVKPSSQFDMKYKVNRKYERLKVKGVFYNDCIILIGKGSIRFYWRYRSGPISVEIDNLEIIQQCWFSKTS